MKNIYTTTLRLNLDNVADQKHGSTCNGWTERSTAP